MSTTHKHDKSLYWLAYSFVISIFLIGCTADTPKIYIIHNSEKTLTTFQQISQTAHTESGKTITNFRFADDQNGKLEITLEFKKAVPPEFAGGVFLLERDGDVFQGAISPVNFRYLGGQGDGVSVGGDFRFSTPEMVYQFHLPLTQLGTFGY